MHRPSDRPVPVTFIPNLIQVNSILILKFFGKRPPIKGSFAFFGTPFSQLHNVKRVSSQPFSTVKYFHFLQLISIPKIRHNTLLNSKDRVIISSWSLLLGFAPVGSTSSQRSIEACPCTRKASSQPSRSAGYKSNTLPTVPRRHLISS